MNVKVFAYRKSDGRSSLLDLESDGITREVCIQDAVSRLVDFKSLKRVSGSPVGFESGEWIVVCGVNE